MLDAILNSLLKHHPSPNLFFYVYSLDFYLSRNVPTYLVGLKADLSNSYQVDPTLVQKIVDLFTLGHFTVDAFSEKGVQQMKDIFKSLLTERDTRGFVYAPTAKPTMESATSEEPADPDIKQLPDLSINKRETNSSFNSYLAYSKSRRESKDSW
jgi:hypothetical protein